MRRVNQGLAQGGGLQGPQGLQGAPGPAGATGPPNIVQINTAVPVAAPGATDLPIYFDDTAVTGGLYVWDSVNAIWLKVSTIP